jgi:hypothetical protein
MSANAQPITFALDFDHCYTLHPKYWDNWILQTEAWGNCVFIVTYRQPSHPLEKKFDIPVYYTDHVAKREFMAAKGIKIDIWIDDNPASIVTSGLQ